jgi:hypothetical protein
MNHLGVLDFSEVENSMLIYPNPVQGEAALGYTLAQNEKVLICLMDLQGRVLETYIHQEQLEAG